MELLKKIAKSLIIGSLVGIGFALFTNYFFHDLIDRLEYVTYYMRYRWEYTDLSKQKLEHMEQNEYGIHIIDIDERSMQKLGYYGNWDRSYQAELINTLSRHFPAAIVYDILFSNPEDRNQQGRVERLLDRSREVNPTIILSEGVRRSIINTIDYDSVFVDATRKAGCVFHGLCLSDETDYRDFALSQIKNKMTMAWHDSLGVNSAAEFPPDVRKQIIDRKTILDGIFPQLARAARAIGHVNIVPNDDGVIREVPLFYGFGNFPPVYFPISVRTIASLFATPNNEIVLVPGKYFDIGKPFKVFKDSSGDLSYSYPNVTTSQIKAILDKAGDIMKLTEKNTLDISSFLAASRDDSGRLSIDMNLPGTLPWQVTDALLNCDLKAVLSLKPGEEFPVAPDIVVSRDSETDWVVRAPFGDQEWWFAKLDMETIGKVDKNDLASVKNNRRKLIFHNFSIHSYDGALVSSLPVLRDNTIRELCTAGWDKLASMKPGMRMDFGKTVRIPLTPDNRHIITFFGPKSKPFPPYSFYDILKDRVQGSLDGKIFIVGSTAPALFDIKPVPHDRNFPAVEIHASLMNSFLTNTFVQRLTVWQDLLILLLVGIVLGFISYMLKPQWGALLTLIAVFVYFLLAMTIFGSQHLWIEIARPILTMIFTFTAVMAYRYITEEKDRKFL